MATQIPNFYTINGVIDTSKSVLENMNLLAEASGCWMTYDIHQGKWAVVINNTGTSTASFTVSNILGSVNISSTSLTEVYNSVEMEFPHKDLTDEPDYVKMSIPSGSRYPNEPDNILSISSQLINNQAQAQSIASRQLKQNRVDKVINFQADYSYIGLKAGDLIDITLDIYGWNRKVFRIMSISEEDSDEGSILVTITALEYDSSVYSTGGLEITPRSRQTGIKSATLNSYIRQSEQGNSATLISASGTAAGLISTYDPVLGKYVLSLGSQKVSIAADRAIITWTFEDGSDLDIRCQLIKPNYITDVDSYLGYTFGTGRYPAESASSIGPTGITQGTPIQTDWLVWGGDNTGVGTENVLVNLGALKTSFPTRTYFAIECRGNWYVTRGMKPITLNVIAYKGGSIADNAGSFSWTVSDYEDAKFVKGLDTFINSNQTGVGGATTLGDLMGYFVFDVTNNTAQFVYGLSDITNQYGAS